VEDPYDIAIVGAGPAGATAGYAAARRGLRVALIDRHSFPRDKPCGDGIGPGAVAVARDLGLADIFTHDVPVQAVTVTGPDGVQLEATTAEMGGTAYGYIVPRRDFDARLAARALKEGADDLTGRKFTRTTITGDLRTLELQARDGTPSRITTRILIGADGANSVVRRALNVPPSSRKNTGIAMRAYALSSAFAPGSTQGPRMLLNFARELLPSYTWLFPTGQPTGIVNIGAGGPLTEFRKTNPDLKQVIAAYADQLRTQGIDLTEPYACRAHHLPHFGGMPRLAHPHAALIGDAGNMINPFSGEGIAYGLAAAARLIDSLPGDLTSSQALNHSLTQWERDFRHDYRAHMASTLLLHRLMHYPAWAKLFISAASRDPAILQDAVALLFGAGRAHVLTAARILRTRLH
jgi:menaquinone-9 beta-reductase